MKHVFVSYAREDKNFARELTRRLRESNRVPWQDIRNIRGGDNWQITIDHALRNAEALVVVMSPNATVSQYVTYEWAFALGAGVRVIPVIRKRTTLHPRLSSIQYIDFSTRRGTPWVNLRKALPSRPGTIHVGPEIYARFKIVGSKLEMKKDYYVTRIYINQPLRNADQVTYEIHDETLERRRWSSKSAATKFESTILSNGDVLITATIRKADNKKLTIASSLFEALQRGHGRKPTKKIQQALRKIEEYKYGGRI